MNRRGVLRSAMVAGAAAAGALPAARAAQAGEKKPKTTARDIVYRGFDGTAALSTGTMTGAAVSGDTLVIATPAGVLDYTDPHTGVTASYEYATWTSPGLATGFAATEVIPSWVADTPSGCWVQIELSGSTTAGTTSKWYNLGRWAGDDTGIWRTSVPSQGDDDGYVAIDTFVAAEGHALTDWRLRVTLLRPAGTGGSPALRAVGAVASALPEPGKLMPSTPQAAQGVVLDVPSYSQHVHDGHYPQWDNGGEAWCSPTSTSMVLAYWGTGPTAADYAWVNPTDPNPWVDHAARHCYDYAYQGCGNWPFNTAYAGRFGLAGFVTRLRSLNEAELFIAAGIPLIFSASFKKNEIPGMGYGSNGHLMVLAGFTADGDPVLNDPAGTTNELVRKVVGRAEFESAWLNTSRGVVYVIHPSAVALPPAPSQANW